MLDGHYVRVQIISFRCLKDDVEEVLAKLQIKLDGDKKAQIFKVWSIRQRI